MINLAPNTDRQIFRRTYVARVAVVGLLVLSVLMIIHAVMLVPSYILLHARVTAQQTEYEIVQRIRQGEETGEIETRLERLESELSLLESVPANDAFIDAVDVVRTVPRNGILLTSISYTPGAEQDELIMRGIAVHRNALRTYARVLEEQQQIISVDFPISDLAQERNLPFTLTVIATL